MQTDCLLLCGNTPKFPLLSFCCLCSELPWRAKVKFKFKTSNRTDLCGVYFTFWKFDPASVWTWFFLQSNHGIKSFVPSHRFAVSRRTFEFVMALQEMLVGQIRVANNYRGKHQESMHAIVPFFLRGGVWGAGCPVEKEGLPPNRKFLYAPKMIKK